MASHPHTGSDKAAQHLADAMAQSRLILIFGEPDGALEAVCSQHGRRSLRLSPSTIGRARKDARRTVAISWDERLLVFMQSDAFLRELAVCAMLAELPVLAETHGYDISERIRLQDVSVFALDQGQLEYVPSTPHGWRIESEDEEIEKQSALMQDCFAAMDETETSPVVTRS